VASLFAVGDAYEPWGNLGKKEVIKILQKFKDPD